MYPYISIDANGYLLPIAAMDKISKEDKDALHEITSYLRELLGKNLRSVILRGSVACGQALEGISDLDLIIFPYQYSDSQKMQIEALSNKLLPKFAHRYSLIDLSYVDCDELNLQKKNTRMIMNMKLVGITVYGENLISRIEPLRKNPELAMRIVNQTLRETNDNLALLATDMGDFSYMGIRRDIDFFCVWMMRVICRGLIAPVMVTEPVFTLNVEASGKEYIRLFPEQTAYVGRMLEWEKHPTNAANTIVSHVDQFLPLYKDTCRKCGITVTK